MPFVIIRGNIAAVRADAVVNAANNRLAPGGGVCGAIFAAAGRERLQNACEAIGWCDTGHAVVTPGFDLPARHIIHAVGPLWQGGGKGEAALLRSAYQASLRLAADMGLGSVAFPLLSAGAYGYPIRQAYAVAVAAIGDFLEEFDMTVYLVLYDKAFSALPEDVYDDISRYIDLNFVDERRAQAPRGLSAPQIMPIPDDACAAAPPIAGAVYAKVVPAPSAAPPRQSLEGALGRREDTFSQAVLRLIDQRGEKDAAVYKRANLDRKLFSKLRSDTHYQPSRATAIALAVALELDIDQTRDLLGRAGYALSPARKSDVIITYFIRRGSFNILEINAALFDFGEACLGS